MLPWWCSPNGLNSHSPTPTMLTCTGIRTC
jgi:hypothetical protein